MKVEGDYRKYMNKNFIGEWDLPDGQDLIVEILSVEQQEVESERGKEQKLCLSLKGYKPLILNVTNSEAIATAIGTKKVEKWIGNKIALYRESVRAFGKTTLAIRVRPFLPKTETIKCVDCGCEIQGFSNYTATQVAEMSKSKYSRALCVECGKKAKEELEKEIEEGDVLKNGEDNED